MKGKELYQAPSAPEWGRGVGEGGRNGGSSAFPFGACVYADLCLQSFLHFQCSSSSSECCLDPLPSLATDLSPLLSTAHWGTKSGASSQGVIPRNGHFSCPCPFQRGLDFVISLVMWLICFSHHAWLQFLFPKIPRTEAESSWWHWGWEEWPGCGCLWGWPRAERICDSVRSACGLQKGQRRPRSLSRPDFFFFFWPDFFESTKTYASSSFGEPLYLKEGHWMFE